MIKRLLLFVSLIASLVLLIGCTEGPVGIFASIESEVRRDLDLGFADNSTVSSMFRVGNTYVASSGRVYIRSATAETPSDGRWTEIAGPSGYDLAADAASFNSLVYGALASTNGEDSGLFTFDPSASDPSWSAATTTGLDATDGVSGLHVVSVGAGDELFVVTTESSQVGSGTVAGYGVYRSTDGSAFSEVIAAGSLRILDIVHDGADYWAIDAQNIYRGSNMAALSTVDTGVSFPSNTAFRGLYYGGPAGEEAVYISTSTGFLVRFEDGSFATHEQALSINEQAVSFSDLVYVEYGEFGALLVGTNKHGYFQLTDGDGDGQVDLAIDRFASLPDVAGTGGNYLPSELSNGAITTFYVDSSPAIMPVENAPSTPPDDSPLVFAGTIGVGLWRNYYYQDKTLWVRE